MALDLPSFKEIVERSRVDVRKVLPTLDPTIYETFINAIIEATSGRHFDITKIIEQLEKEVFPDTAILENLKRWAAYDGIDPFTAEQSSGPIMITGLASKVIAAGLVLTDADGYKYETQTEETITEQILTVASITRTGTTVTVTTDYDHNLASNAQPVIAGADQTSYNGTFQVAVVGVKTFTYEISDSPTTPATGTITATLSFCSVNVNSQDTGEDKNLQNGAALTFVATPTDVDDIAYVAYGDLTGGSDEETKASVLSRVKDKRANPVSNFNVGAIRKVCFEIEGVTRVKVKKRTPIVGQVTILFVRDNDDDIIPSSIEVQTVKDAIVAIQPATDDDDDVIVTAPTATETAYEFASISPDTKTMQNAIDAQLAYFYKNYVDFETTITEEKYKSIIAGTIDPDTGDRLQSFTLSSPTGDISVSTDGIGTYGGSNFL